MPLTRRALVRGGLAALCGLPRAPLDTLAAPLLDPGVVDEHHEPLTRGPVPPPPPPPSPPPAAEPEPEPEPASGADVAALALGYLGVPYVWGGATPDGWDCSGCVRWLYAQVGVALPRTTWAQIGAGEPVPYGAILPGDLLFWNTEGPSPGHVSLALGGGRMLHALNEQVGTIVGTMGGSYWSGRFVGARRVR